MSIAFPVTEHPEAPLFADGLGDRAVTADGATGELLQVLHLRPALTAVPSFEFALRERAARLANFRHASYARVRRIDRTMSPTPALAVISDHVEGTRLSELLRVAQERNLPLDINAAMCLIRQLVPAVALLHDNARDAAHGLIAPERLVVTPQGRLVIVEHVLGAAVEQLQYGRDRLWNDFRVVMPATAGLPRFDHRSDVAGIGLVALALILGRPIGRDEYPYHVTALLNETQARIAPGEKEPLSAAMRGWIARALQLEVRRAFASASEAALALDDVLGSEALYVAAPVALDTFLSRYAASLLEPPLTPPQTNAAAAAPPAPAPAAKAPSAPPVVPPPVAAKPPVVAPSTVAPPSVAPPARAAQPVVTAPPVAKPVPPAVAPRVASAAEPVAAQSAISKAADITDLIDLDGLTDDVARPVSATSGPLFNPDAPFTVPVTSTDEPPAGRRGPSRALIAVAVLLLALGGGGLAAMKMGLFAGPTAAPAQGTLVVESNPSGVPVFVDGVDRGVTPARIIVSAGAHILELRRGVPRVIPLNVTAGSEVSKYLEFAEAPLLGQLAIQSDPAGAKVFVDGTERGVAPMTIAELTPGEHEVVLQSDAATAKHVVVVQAGGTASLVVPMPGSASSGPVSGWVAVKSPFRIEIFEGGRLVGTTDVDRLMLAAGRHELELVNESLGYRTTRVVQVPPGKIAPITLELPKGNVSINATPWAEVWIDGERAGETPIGNLSVPIGSHEIVFRHPQLGEKRHAVSVTLGAPVRVSIDMKQ